MYVHACVQQTRTQKRRWTVGVADGTAVDGTSVGVGVGGVVFIGGAVGEANAAEDGMSVGHMVGDADGMSVGVPDGSGVGGSVGSVDGGTVGTIVGIAPTVSPFSMSWSTLESSHCSTAGGWRSARHIPAAVLVLPPAAIADGIADALAVLSAASSYRARWTNLVFQQHVSCHV